MRLTRGLPKLFMLAVLVVGGISFWVYYSVSNPVTHSNAARYITIEPGLASNLILEKLAHYQVIQAPLATKIICVYLAKVQSLDEEVTEVAYARTYIPS